MLTYTQAHDCKRMSTVSLAPKASKVQLSSYHLRTVCHASRSNNLGALNQAAATGQPSPADLQAMQDVPNRSTAFEGIYISPGAIAGSSILLAVLLALSFERILGLDQVGAQ